MSNYKEMLQKTGMQVIGICKGVSEYVGKNKTYYSVDLEVEGAKNSVNIKLPDDYDRSKLPPYELVKIMLTVRPSFDRKSIELHAIA